MDYGLLGGIGAFGKGFMDSYESAQDRKYKRQQDSEEEAMKKKLYQIQMMEKGVEEDPAGNIVKSNAQKHLEAADRANKRAGLLKSGYDLGDYDPMSGEYKVNKVPGYHDSEEELRKANIRHINAETYATIHKPAPDVKPEQGQAALYGKRMQQAEQILGDLEGEGFDRTSMGAGLLSALPTVMQPGQLQQQEQAERNFVNAVLRRESGSAISPSEFNSAEKQYFPRAGDSPEVREQKRANRQLAIQGLEMQSGGRAWSGLEIPEATGISRQAKQGGLIPSASAKSQPKEGQVEDGYVFIGGNPADEKSWRKDQ